MSVAIDVDGSSLELPRDVVLLSPVERELGAEIVDARVVRRIAFDPRMSLLVLHVTTRTPRQNGRGNVEHGRAVLALVGGTRSIALTVRSRSLGAVIGGLGEVHAAIEVDKRAHGVRDRDGLRVLHLPDELLDEADEAGTDAETIAHAASRAFLELDLADRRELIAEIRKRAA